MNATCGTCSTPLLPGDVLYDQRGNVSCQRCLLAAQAGEARKQSAGKVVGIAYGGPALGLLAFVFNPFWLVSVAAVANGLYVLRSLKHPDAAEHLSRSAEKVKVAAIAGIVLGSISGILYVLRFMG